MRRRSLWLAFACLALAAPVARADVSFTETAARSRASQGRRGVAGPGADGGKGTVTRKLRLRADEQVAVEPRNRSGPPGVWIPMKTLPTSRLMLPYIEQGDPDGVPLIIIHGLTDSHRSYEPILAELPDSIRAFAVTMRGHGDAPKPESGYTAADFAGDVIAFMDALEIERAVIAGHSMGAWIARRVAADHPERVLGVVLAGCFATFDTPDIRGLLAEFDSLADPVPPGYAREWQESTLARPIPEAFMQTIIEETRKPPVRVWTAALGAMVADPQDGLITAPTLLVYGERDALVPRSDQDALLEAIPGAELIAHPGGGHAFHWEQPERYAAQLMAFAAML